MIRPKIKSNGYSSVTLPEFTGGVNGRDVETSIKDNQLAAARNVLYVNGELRTRYGFGAVGDVLNTAYVNEVEAKNGVPWDWVYSRTHNLTVEHVLDEKYNWNGNSWALQNTGDLHLKNVYICHNSFRNTWQKDEGHSNHVYGNVNTWLITDEGEQLQAYITHANSDENPGQLVFMYYKTRYMTYSGKPVLENGLGLFLYICGRYGGGKSSQKFRLYELKHTKDSDYAESLQGMSYVWEELTEEYFYAPTVLVNGKGNTYSYLPANEFTEYASQSTWESFNLMTPKFKAYFTTDGGYYTNSSGEKTWKGSRSFTIPWTVARVKKSDNDYVLAHDFKITYTDNAGNENVITIPAGYNNSEVVTNFSADGYEENEGFTTTVRIAIKLYSQKATVFFYHGPLYSVEGTVTDKFVLPRGMANNLLFEGYTKEKGGVSAIGDMSGCEWFGGSGEGLSGGTRLFLYGGEYEPNHLMWSDVDNPLYFPENNDVYVGDQSDKITKIAKQSSMLAIFKKYSVHCATYVDNSTSYTTEDVLNGLVSDVASVSAIFPLTQISGEIGCDLPSTVQLCDNHLVWCNSDGRIYTLKTADQYSENNVYELSYPVFPLIKKKIKELAEAKAKNNLFYSLSFNKELINRNCFAADFNGMYWLAIGDTIFVMKYADSGFKYAYSYREGNSVKRSLGYDVLSLENGIFKTLSLKHKKFKSLDGDEKYTAEALAKLNASDYEFSDITANVYRKSAGFIKGKDGLYFILESKITRSSNRSDVMCRSARIFQLQEDSYADTGLQDITGSGNDSGSVSGFKISYGDEREAPIDGEMKTKLYDFGGNSTKKRIEHIYFDIFPKTDVMVTVVAHTERGRELLKMFPVYEAEGPRSEHIRCNLHGVRRLALEITLSGAAAIGGFQVKYKKLGR